MRHLAVGLCCVVLASLCAAPASATLIGDTVNITTQNIFGTFNIGDFTVQEGIVEYNNGAITIDFESESIRLGYLFIGGQDSNTWLFSDLDWLDAAGDPIDGKIVDVIVSSNLPSSFIQSVTFGDHNVTLAVSGGSIAPNDYILMDLVTEHADIPEPTTMALLATGAVGLIAKRRRVVC